MSEISIPPAFASGVVAERGESGLHWLQALPAKIENYCVRWNLVVDGEPLHGYLGLVVPMRRGRDVCALKVTWIDEETRYEALALRLWAGEGAVKLLDAQPEDGVLLFERLDATCSLVNTDIEEAVTVAGRLLRRLAIPAPPGLPSLREYAERQSMTMHERWEKRGRPFPERLVSFAQDAAKQLGPSARNMLVNYDLHYENVLAGKREPWLVIDPKVIAGDIEFGVAPLLWTRLEKDNGRAALSQRFTILTDIAELDRYRARCWTLVRCVDYWLWALNLGLTDDPARCEIIAEWLLNDA